MSVNPADWVNFGLAGLFALYALVILKYFLDFLEKERAAILKTDTDIVQTLVKINESLVALTQVMVQHDSRVRATMDVMSRFVDHAPEEKKS